MRTFQVILETIPRATLTQTKSQRWMSYCLEQIVDINRQRLHFASKTVLMCHVCHHQTMQQTRLTASQPCQPDDSTGVSLTAEGFCQLTGIQVGSRQGNRSINNPTSDGNSRDPDAQIILPYADRKLPAKPVPHIPFKTSLPVPKNVAGGRHALDGRFDSKRNLLLHKNVEP
jgi:hypothetical protein